MDINAMYLRSRFWILDFFKGSPIRKHYNEIMFLDTHNSEECQEKLNKKLEALLLHAKKHSEFYAKYDSLNLKDYPVMNKLSLIANMDSIKVAPSVIPGQVGDVHIQRTSGSTGVPLAVPQDTQKRYRRIAELKYYGKKVGFTTHEKLIHLRTWNRWQNKTNRQSRLENIIAFDISKFGPNELEELCNLLISEKVVCLRGYSTTIASLASYIKNSSKKWAFPHLRIIIAGGEALYDDVRQMVKEYMKCEIISQYADEECGIMAQERIPTNDSDNVMYFNHASYFFEVLKLDSDEPAEYGELGRIVITDLHNYAFPIIRYDCGDTCVMMPPNEYSNGYPVIEKLYGRRFDLTYSTDGKAIAPLTFGRMLKNYDIISQWQFVQLEEKKYELRLMLKSGSVDQLAEVVGLFKDILGKDALLEIKEVQDIPVLSSGKRKPVVNEWKNN